METDFGILFPKEATRPHDRASRSHTGDEGVGPPAVKIELPPDFRPGRRMVGRDIVRIGELAGEKRAGRPEGQLLGQADTAQKAAFLGADQADVGAQAADQVDPLRAHPVGHEDGDRMAESPADGRERDAGVPAGRFDDQTSGRQGPAFVGLAENMKGHAVLDAAGHIQVFSFGVQDPPLTAEREFNLQQRRVADQAGELEHLLFLIVGPLGHQFPPLYQSNWKFLFLRTRRRLSSFNRRAPSPREAGRE